MPDTALVLNDVRSKLYRQLGEPAADMPNSAGGVLDDNLQFAARKIIAEIAFVLTGEDAQMGELTTVADQQKYPVPDNVEVVHVYWGPSGISDIPTDPYARQFGNIPGSGLDGAFRGFYWHSDQVAADIRRKQIEQKWRWEVIAGFIYLYPVPTGVVPVKYLFYPTNGGVTDLDVRYELPLIYLAAFLSCDVMSNRARGHGTTFTQEGITEGDKALEWEGIGAKYWEKFRREMVEILY